MYKAGFVLKTLCTLYNTVTLYNILMKYKYLHTYIIIIFISIEIKG